LDRIYGTLELRSVDEERREFEGIANTGCEDSHGTVVEPAGAKFSLPLPLLFHHDSETPVGEITSARLVNGQWIVRGTIRKIDEPGYVKDATDRAWHNVKHKLMRGLSVGFQPLKQVGNRFVEWMWRELSIVTLPSNSECSILAVRSAFGAPNTSPGVSGQSTNNPKRQMTVQEQITQYENTRAAKVAARDAILAKANDEGRTLDEQESEQFDTLDTEIRSVDDHLVRLNTVKQDNEKRAAPVVATSIAKASESRSGVPIVTVRSNQLPGLGFARYVMSLVRSRGNHYEAAEYAKHAFGDDGENIALMHRAAVAAGTTTETNWALPLVQTNYVNEFLELLRPQTLLGRIPGLRKVPFNTSMPAQTGGGTYGWVGEGAPKPVTKPQYASVTLSKAKAAGIIVLTKELVRLSTPSAQEAVRDEMLAGIRQFLDTQFVDSTVAAVSGVNPASITNGVSGTAASGTDVADARSDIAARIAAFAAANYGLNGLVILMSESQAFALGTMINSVGQPAFPGLNINGGTILGVPVVTSETVGSQIIFAHTPSILVADEGGIEIDASEEASLQMDSAPDDPSDGDTVYVSMFQRNLVALRVERMITWGKARSTAVDRITSAAYVA
jgi:HK97 family phage major capsid protein/HK97 family phage prohead protease